MIKKIVYLLPVLFLSACDRIDSILWEPKITPEEWCKTMPCVKVPSTELILNQPFSTFLIYVLGFMWLWAGWYFWKTRNGQNSKIWWSISLVLGGVAAISAGTSYQAFSYEIKCTGREFCMWTSWWEIVYLVIQIASLNAMLVAVAYSCTVGRLRKNLIIYAFINSGIHFVVTVVGVLLPNKFMISFEMLVLFTAPTFMMYFIINSWRYKKYKNPMDLVLLGAWLLLTIINIFYFSYLLLGYTEILWSKGIWFSANDVLHVGMMFWVLYVMTVVSKRVEDHP